MKTPITCEIFLKLITRTRQAFAMGFYIITLEKISIKVFTFILLTLRMFPPSRKFIPRPKKNIAKPRSYKTKKSTWGQFTINKLTYKIANIK